MDNRADEVTFEGLMYWLASANAKLQDEAQADLEATLAERKQILELVVRHRQKQDALIGF